jgi:hypothetical protein
VLGATRNTVYLVHAQSHHNSDSAQRSFLPCPALFDPSATKETSSSLTIASSLICRHELISSILQTNIFLSTQANRNSSTEIALTKKHTQAVSKCSRYNRRGSITPPGRAREIILVHQIEIRESGRSKVELTTLAEEGPLARLHRLRSIAPRPELRLLWER